MQVRVKLFAAAHDLAGRDVVAVAVAEAATIADVRAALVAAVPALANVVSHSLWAIGAQCASDTARVTEQSDIALIPPVSGG